MPIHKHKVIGILLFLSLISLAHRTMAADLSIVTSPAQVKVGDTVTATVYVNADGKAINNVEAAISVPSDLLEIQSVSQSGSTLTLWVEQPSFGNGTVTFNGGISNPGYSGSSGKVITFYMKALKTGSAQLSFKTGSVRANDGLGTDVTKGRSGATVTVSSPAVVPVVAPAPAVPAPVVAPTPAPKPPSAPAQKPDAPVVTSDSMPDENAWYKDTSTIVSWDVPAGVTGVRTLLGPDPDSDPTVQQPVSSKTKTLSGLEEGVTYFHIKFQNAAGWSPVTHRKFQIDSSAPEIPKPQYRTLDSGAIVLEFAVEDAVSGIAKVVLTTPGESAIEIASIPENNIVQVVFPRSYEGTKEIRVETFDRAGNSSMTQVTIPFPARAEAVAEPAGFDLGAFVQKALAAFVSASTSVLGVVSRLDPLTVLVCAAFILLSLGIYKAILAYQYRKRYESLAQMRSDVNAMMGIARRNMKRVSKAIVMDKSIKNVEVAEDMLAESIMDDVKDIEKVLKAKADARKKERKRME